MESENFGTWKDTGYEYLSGGENSREVKAYEAYIGPIAKEVTQQQYSLSA